MRYSDSLLRLRWSTLLLSGVFGACAPTANDSADHAAVSVSQTVTLTAGDVQILGSSESIATVLDLTLLPDGRVWVLNSGEPFFVGFGRDGQIIDQHGMRGGGPREFQSPAGFVAGDIDGEAWVLDTRRHSLIRVSQPQSPWLEVQLPRDSLPPGSLVGGMGWMNPRVRAARLGDEIVMARSFGSIRIGMFAFWETVWGADLFAVRPETGSVARVLGLRDVLGDPSGELERSGDFPPFPLWFRLWGVCSGGEVRFHDRLRNEIRGYSRDGGELPSMPLPPPAFTEASEDEFARGVFGLLLAERLGEVGGRVTAADSTRLMNEMRAEMQGDTDLYGRFLPRYVDFRCGDDGAVWIQPIDLEKMDLQGGRTWLHVSSGGLSKTVEMPDRFDPLRFVGGQIWGVQRDEFGLASIGWIDLTATTLSLAP